MQMKYFDTGRHVVRVFKDSHDILALWLTFRENMGFFTKFRCLNKYA